MTKDNAKEALRNPFKRYRLIPSKLSQASIRDYRQFKMNEYVQMLLMYLIAPGVIAIGSYVMNAFLKRVSDLEKTMIHKVEEPEVRQLMADKIDPIREDIQELKGKIELIYSLLLKK